MYTLYVHVVAALGAVLLEEIKEPSYLTTAVGEYVVFNCDLDFPHEIPIPYILHWNRDVSHIQYTSSRKHKLLMQ